jgi:tetratricopeptide (TPR) repeat protein
MAHSRIQIAERHASWFRPTIGPFRGTEVGARHAGYGITGNMDHNRLEILLDMLARNPADSFARYGLAMEYANSGRLEDAVVEYEKLLTVKPDYVAAYYHGGQALQKLGRREEAREMYNRGIEASSRAGDLHAKSELEVALDLLG